MGIGIVGEGKFAVSELKEGGRGGGAGEDKVSASKLFVNARCDILE